MIYYDGTIGLPGTHMVSPQEGLEFLGPVNYGDRLADTLRAEPKGWRRDLLKILLDFPDGPVVRNSPANAGNMGSIPGLGRFRMPRGN